MRYVKKILSTRTSLSVRSKHVIGGNGISGQVIVHDTLNGTDEVCDIQSLVDSAVLGVAINQCDLCGAVVKHTAKTAKLHSHIVSAELSYSLPQVSLVEDMLLLRTGVFHGFVNTGSESLSINLEDEAVKVGGVLGSVVLWFTKGNDSNPKVYTLYDLLGELNRISGQNILTYKQIRLFSASRNITSTIRLSDSPGAKRFLSKMYLDVCRW